MPNYTHVQFISWEIYTGPNRGPLSWPQPKQKPPGLSYSGLGKEDNEILFPFIKMIPPIAASDKRLDVAGQIVDIRARLSFTYDAINEAVPHVDSKPTTLKLFMAPEFLYRGKGGAYIHDLINGWKGPPPAELAVSGCDDFPGLFGSLQRWIFRNRPVGNQEFRDWLFVFGTAISASFPARNENGKWVRDPTQIGEIYNTALIQGGEDVSAAYASRKHYISGIDFINYSYRSNGFSLGTVGPIDPEGFEPKETDREGSATFEIKGVNDKDGHPIIFGLEVCLDHYRKHNGGQWGRIRAADKWVQIQLVPSGGMELQPASIRLLPTAGPTPRSYAFNCDGLTSLQPDSQWGAHTEIWNGVEKQNQLINTNLFQRGGKAVDTIVAPVPCQTSPGFLAAVYAHQLWDLGAGCVRIMQPMPL